MDWLPVVDTGWASQGSCHSDVVLRKARCETKRFPQFPNKSYLINAVHPIETRELGWVEGEKNKIEHVVPRPTLMKHVSEIENHCVGNNLELGTRQSGT
jgi:hypothetical protein